MTFTWADVQEGQIADNAVINDLGNTVEAHDVALSLLFPTAYVRKPADNTPVNNSTTLVDDTHLSLPIGTDVITSDFRAIIIYTSNTTANLKVAFTFPGSMRMDFGIACWVLGGVNTANFQGFSNYTSGTTIQVSGATGPASLHVSGSFITGGTAGSLKLQFAQLTANASNTFTMTGSLMAATRL